MRLVLTSWTIQKLQFQLTRSSQAPSGSYCRERNGVQPVKVFFGPQHTEAG